MKKAEKKVKILGFALVVVISILIVVLRGGRVDAYKCNCNFGMYEIATAQI